MARTHGLASTYNNGKCRCTPCREAATEASRERRANRGDERVYRDGRWIYPGPQISHGRAATYQHFACRCEPCTTANRKPRAAQSTPTTDTAQEGCDA